MDAPQESQLSLDSADALNYTLDIAGVGARAYAFIIDWHIRLLAAVVWVYLAMQLLVGNDAIQAAFFDADTDTTAMAIIFLPALIAYLFYHPVLEIVMRGRTPGKRIAEVRLVTTQGHIPAAGSLLVRNIFRLIDSLPGVYTVGLVVALVTEKHLRIGDMAAGTVLVYENRQANDSLTDVVEQTLNASLPAQDYELLLEILERWPQLLPDKRLQLGRQLLARIGDDFDSDNDKTMKDYLETVKAGRQQAIRPS